MRCESVLQGSELFAFERYMTFRKSGGNHCQLNVFPVSATAAASARADVERLARDHGVPLQPLDGPSKVSHHSLTAAWLTPRCLAYGRGCRDKPALVLWGTWYVLLYCEMSWWETHKPQPLDGPSKVNQHSLTPGCLTPRSMVQGCRDKPATVLFRTWHVLILVRIYIFVIFSKAWMRTVAHRQ